MCPVKPSTKPQNKTSITTKLTLVVVYFILFAYGNYLHSIQGPLLCLVSFSISPSVTFSGMFL